MIRRNNRAAGRAAPALALAGLALLALAGCENNNPHALGYDHPYGGPSGNPAIGQNRDATAPTPMNVSPGEPAVGTFGVPVGEPQRSSPAHGYGPAGPV